VQKHSFSFEEEVHFSPPNCKGYIRGTAVSIKLWQNVAEVSEGNLKIWNRKLIVGSKILKAILRSGTFEESDWEIGEATPRKST
jgi:hypothetical protein